jgi:hypothetical protein
MIANNKITYDHLNVCLITPDNKDLKDNKNCSKCYKCARTMVSLDILGHLDQYQKVFDLSIYKKNRNKYLAELLYKKFRSRDVLAKEIFKEAKERNYTIPVIVYYYSFLRVFQPIVRKIKNA